MSLLAKAKYVEKKSKFLAYLFENPTEADLEMVRATHKKANHVCYAINTEDEQVFKNDGEVGQPGRTLLSLLQEKELTTHALIVARYFGGIKLGPGGVSRAFKSAAKMCLENEAR